MRPRLVGGGGPDAGSRKHPVHEARGPDDRAVRRDRGRAVRRSSGAAPPQRRRVGRGDVRAGGRGRRGGRARPVDARRRAGRPGLPAGQHPRRLDVREPRHLQHGLRRGAGLPDQRARGVRVGRGQLRGPRHRLRGRRPGREDHAGPRRPARARGDRRDRRPGRRRRPHLRGPARPRAGPGRPRRARPPPRRGHARGPLLHRLHLGHDRAAQGHGAHPRQLLVGRGHGAGDRLRHRRGRQLPLPAARARLRADRPDRVLRRRHRDHLLRRRHRSRSSPSWPRRSRRTSRRCRGSSRSSTRMATAAVEQAPAEDQVKFAKAIEVGFQVRELERDGDARPRRPARRLRGGGRPRLRQRPRALRRPGAPGGVGRGADRAGDPAVLRGLRRHGARGLRDDGDHGRGLRGDARALADRHGGAPDARRRGAHRRGRRDPDARPEHLQGVLAQPGGDGRDLQRGRLAA